MVALGGDAILREARVAQGQEERLVAQFITQADAECRQILAELQREGATWWPFRVAITWPVSATISTQTSGTVYARPSCGSEE